MGRFDTIKTTIDANIKTNGNQEITGQKLNLVLNEVVNATDAELTELESEVGADGKTYTSSVLTNAGFIQTDGTVNPYDVYGYSDKIVVYKGQKITATSNLSASALVVALYDVNNNFVRGIAGKGALTTETIVVENEAYMRVCHLLGGASFFLVATSDGGLVGNIKSLQTEVTSLSKAAPSLFRDVQIPFTENGFINAADGKFLASASSGATDYIDLSTITKIVASLYENNTQIAAIAYYDADKNFISAEATSAAYAITNYEWKSFAEGARYARLSTAFHDSVESSINCVVNEAINIAEDLRIMETAIYEPIVITNPSFIFKQKGIWFKDDSIGAAGELIATGGTNEATDFIYVGQLKKAIVRIPTRSANTASIAFYDKDKMYLGSEQYLWDESVKTLESFPANTRYVRITQDTYFGSDVELHCLIDLNHRVSEIETTIKDTNEVKYWAACGDSITNANHDSIYDVELTDKYCPIDGYADVSTYRRKNYAYYIAKKHNLQWANYGYGGTILTNGIPKAFENRKLFPFAGDRLTQMKEGINWDYISIFFGYNDCTYEPIYQRDLWLKETYGEDIGYPAESAQIGTSGFANAAQKAACDAAVGSVGGVTYDNSEEYFIARFIGTIDDNTDTTWCGAWNKVLPYLMKKYPKSKILIIAPYIGEVYSAKIIEATKQIAEKWGVEMFDFQSIPDWFYKTNPNNTPLRNDAREDGQWVTENGRILPATIEGYNQARYSFDTLHPSNLGYLRIFPAIADKLLK